MAIHAIADFSGGISLNSKTGPAGSCRFSRNLNIFTDANSVTLNPIPVKDSGTVVTDLVKWIVDANPYLNARFAYGDSGNIYKIVNNVWTLDRSGATILHGAAGQGLCVFADYLYYSTSSTIGRLGPLDGTPVYNDDYFTDGIANLDPVSDTSRSGSTYAVLATLDETNTHQKPFVPTRDPIVNIIVIPTAKGTGNWTVTVHDNNNTSLGTSTVPNLSLTNGAENNFNFSTSIRVVPGGSYHFHVTSTVGDGTMQTSTLNDARTVYFKITSGVLIADLNYHPLAQHVGTNAGTPGATLIVGNKNYIGEWLPTTYNPCRIKLEPGYDVRFFVRDSEYQVAGCWRGTSITGFEEGRYYFWDGQTPIASYQKPVTGGLPNAGEAFKGRVMSVHGSTADLSMGVDPMKRIQPVPKLTAGKTVEVLPGAIDVWQNRLQIGIGANSTDNASTGLEQGVYEFGNRSDKAVNWQAIATEVLNYGYQISTGDTQSTNMKIGCVQAFGQDMYISWKSDAGTFGVDRVNTANNPAATGSWESLVIDVGLDKLQQPQSLPNKSKLAELLIVTYASLPTGCTVTPKYKLDRASSFTLATAEAIGTAGSTSAVLPINNRYKEIEVGFNLAATVNYPVITGVFLVYDPLLGETEEA